MISKTLTLLVAGASAQNVVSTPCCNIANVCDSNTFASGMNYCDAGSRDSTCIDNDITTDINKYVDNSKCTDITRNNRCVGPNVKKCVNEVSRNLATNINKQHSLR